MAYFRETTAGKVKAEIEHKGTRKARTFLTREAAEAWAKDAETCAEQVAARRETSQVIRDALANSSLLSILPRRVLDANRAIPHTGPEIAEGALPRTLQAGIYFLVEGSQVVYVGQSTNCMRRIGRHIDDGRISFDSFNVLPCPPERLDELEELYITALCPVKNWTFGKLARSEA